MGKGVGEDPWSRLMQTGVLGRKGECVGGFFIQPSAHPFIPLPSLPPLKYSFIIL